MNPTPIGFAHRGARAHASENTLAAFELALDMGATGLESDVWLTADGVAVLDHDGKGIAETRRADLPGHIPTLAELYEKPGTRIPLSLDVKDERAADEVLRVAGAAGALSELWLCHPRWKTVAGWRQQSDRVRLVDSTRRHRIREGAPERALTLAASGIDAINLHHSDWTPDWVAIFHDAGVLAFAWDLQEPGDLERLLGFRVDAVYSDHVDRMMRAVQSWTEGTGAPTSDRA